MWGHHEKLRKPDRVGATFCYEAEDENAADATGVEAGSMVVSADTNQ